MSTNPYESPSSPAQQRPLQNEPRSAARRSVRIALLMLLMPALYNFACFNFPPTATLPIHRLYQAVNSLGLISIVAFVWFFGLTCLEGVTGGIHAMVARTSSLAAWKNELYAILSRLPWFAIPGAVLWTIWVAAVYQLRIGFYAVSVPVGIAAHVLAACLYVPLAYRWYKLEQQRLSNSNS
ncbi:MAG: hypothetical protein R3C28_25650 [Pirellulaceae bacterium]